MILFCYKPSCFSDVYDYDHRLVSMRMAGFAPERQEAFHETRSPSASLLFKGQGTEHITVKWPITREEKLKIP